MRTIYIHSAQIYDATGRSHCGEMVFEKRGLAPYPTVGSPGEEFVFESEVVRARKFIRGDLEIRIGMDGELSEAIGLQYEAFETLLRENAEYTRALRCEQQKVDKLDKALKRVQGMTILECFKAMFVGVKGVVND